MLPATHRLRRPADFHATLRGRGTRRSGGRLVVVHAKSVPDRAGLPPRVGFVVSKAVGNSVVRHRTTRRLREIFRLELPALPDGVDLVVRANPAAATASFAELCRAVQSQLPQVVRR